MATTRKFFSRSRKHVPLDDSSYDYTTDDKIFSSRDTNLSTSALSSHSNASRTSRFFRRFGRSKAPPVPSLPPTLVLDLDAATPQPSTPKNGSATPTTAAAAIIAESNAAYAAAETLPKPLGLQKKKMLDAMANARLNVAQTRDLVRLCGLQIRERGLDTPGLFRPFRVTESQERGWHMIQLFLLSIDPSTYIAVFPILPDSALDRFGRKDGTSSNAHDTKAKIAREELDKELRYAAPHDLVSVLKWGLRHMRVLASDFHSSDADQWYHCFTTAERESGYDARAIADLLHPKLPEETAELLSETLDLMASVAAHTSSNHMPAATLCKVLGFWLLGRIGVAHPPPTYDELLEAVEDAAAKVEHLMLAHIRSQAAVTFSMPLRLTELVQNYPYIKPGTESPSLPPTFASRTVPTLRIDLKSDNLVVSQAKPRSPSSTLADALDATAADGLKGGQGDMWAGIMMQIDQSVSRLEAGYELLGDEHVRILRNVDAELNTEEKEQRETLAAAAEAASPIKRADPTARSARRRSQSLSDLYAAAGLPALTETSIDSSSRKNSCSPTKPSVLTSPKRKPVPLLAPSAAEEELEVVDDHLFSGGSALAPSASWRSFSEEGFGGMSTASSDLSLSEFDLKPHTSTLPPRRSTRSLYRVKSGSPRKRAPFPMPPAPLPISEAKPNHIVTAASMIEADTSFAILWLDQVLDGAPCCRFPPLVFVQLNSKTASALERGADAEASVPAYPGETPWLVIVETIIPPRPPTPPMTPAGGGAREDGDRRSIFAPSMKSVKMRLRRVSTVIGTTMGGGRKNRPGEDMARGLSES